MTTCQGCGTGLPISNGNRPRKWCSEWCRKRHSVPATPSSAADGPVTVAVRSALETELALTAVDRAYAALAVRTAQMVDVGSVPAIAQLRAVLAELAGRVDDGAAEFLQSLQVANLLK